MFKSILWRKLSSKLVPGSFSWRLRVQEDANLMSKEKRGFIELKIRELAQKLRISKPVELIEIKGLAASAQALGNEIFSGRIGIAIDSELAEEMQEDELEFILAHELSHIKANDLIWMGTVSGIVGVITTLAMSILFPSSATYFSTLIMASSMISSPAALVGFTVSAIAFVFFSIWREECADKLGFSVCSDAAKRAAPKFFDKIRVSQINYRNDEKITCFRSLWRKFLITKKGEFRFDIFHPSLEARISYLQSKSLRLNQL